MRSEWAWVGVCLWVRWAAGPGVCQLAGAGQSCTRLQGLHTRTGSCCCRLGFVTRSAAPGRAGAESGKSSCQPAQESSWWVRGELGLSCSHMWGSVAEGL